MLLCLSYSRHFHGTNEEGGLYFNSRPAHISGNGGAQASIKRIIMEERPMNKFYLSATALVSLVVFATSSGVAMAKGGDDNPVIVSIDQSGSSNDVDANITNDSSNPVPVTVVNSELVSVQVFENVDSPTSRVTLNVFEVPPGKILIVNYVSILLDVAVNRPGTGLRIAGGLGGIGSTDRRPVEFELGYMEEFEQTSRGTPNFIVARNVTAYFSQGAVQCVADSHFAGSDLDFGFITCSLAGRLVDAPAPQ
jgi:hypothetical protein